MNNFEQNYYQTKYDEQKLPPRGVSQPLCDENLLLPVQMEVLRILALREDLPVVLQYSDSYGNTASYGYSAHSVSKAVKRSLSLAID